MNIPDWFYLGCIVAIGIGDIILYCYLRSFKKQLDKIQKDRVLPYIPISAQAYYPNGEPFVEYRDGLHPSMMNLKIDKGSHDPYLGLTAEEIIKEKSI